MTIIVIEHIVLQIILEIWFPIVSGHRLRLCERLPNSRRQSNRWGRRFTYSDGFVCSDGFASKSRKTYHVIVILTTAREMSSFASDEKTVFRHYYSDKPCGGFQFPTKTYLSWRWFSAVSAVAKHNQTFVHEKRISSRYDQRQRDKSLHTDLVDFWQVRMTTTFGVACLQYFVVTTGTMNGSASYALCGVAIKFHNVHVVIYYIIQPTGLLPERWFSHWWRREMRWHRRPSEPIERMYEHSLFMLVHKSRHSRALKGRVSCVALIRLPEHNSGCSRLQRPEFLIRLTWFASARLSLCGGGYFHQMNDFCSWIIDFYSELLLPIRQTSKV